MAVRVNTKGFWRKQRKVMRKLKDADVKAQRDAAKQTRTEASKRVRQKLNLPKKQADKDLYAERRGGGWRFRASYQRTPAHRFTSYRPNGRTPGGKPRYLRVKFSKGKPAMTFRKGFTIASGGAKVALQRKGRARLPLVGITGPSAYSQVKAQERPIRAHGRAAYVRRSGYWKTRELSRIN